MRRSVQATNTEQIMDRLRLTVQLTRPLTRLPVELIYCLGQPGALQLNSKTLGREQLLSIEETGTEAV